MSSIYIVTKTVADAVSVELFFIELTEALCRGSNHVGMTRLLNHTHDRGQESSHKWGCGER